VLWRRGRPARTEEHEIQEIEDFINRRDER